MIQSLEEIVADKCKSINMTVNDLVTELDTVEKWNKIIDIIHCINY